MHKKLTNNIKIISELTIPEYKNENIEIINLYINLLYTGPNEFHPGNAHSIIIDACNKHVKNKNFILKEIIANKDNFPLIHSVGKGGEYSPRLLVCGIGVNNEKHLYDDEYNFCFIGKGVTFDTGGYSLKPNDSMIDMSIDKSGSLMALFSAVYNYNNNDIKTIVIMPIVQNHISSNSYTPGEIIQTKLGELIHIGNTDAEGRLILADAIEYAVENFKFKYCFNYATLTGACIVAIGYGRTAYMTKSNKVSKDIEEINNTGIESICKLPFDKHYMKLIKKNIRNKSIINNIGNIRGSAGTIVGGIFLDHIYHHAHNVLNKTNIPPFCHFDIAALITTDYLKNMTHSYNIEFLNQLCNKLL